MPPALLYFANFLWLLTILTALYRARRQLPRLQPVAIHLFCGAIPVLTLLALLKTAAAPGLELHLIGLTAATLLMGARLAILAAAFSQLLLLTLGELPPVALGLNGLTHAAIPVAISASFAALLRRYLPPNPFIYTLGAGFFGGILALSARDAHHRPHPACGRRLPLGHPLGQIPANPAHHRLPRRLH